MSNGGAAFCGQRGGVFGIFFKEYCFWFRDEEFDTSLDVVRPKLIRLPVEPEVSVSPVFVDRFWWLKRRWNRNFTPV